MSEQGYVIHNPELPVAMQKSLSAYGWVPLAVPVCSAVHPALQGHPDLQLCVIDSDEIVVQPEISSEFLFLLQQIFKRVIVGTTKLGEKYPHDIPYNVALIGEYGLHQTDYTDPILLKRLAFSCIEPQFVTQGYTGCSTLVINDNALITADSYIAATAEELGIDALLIEAGHIILPGMNYGFIGGAAGYDGLGTVFFCGDLSSHPDSLKIMRFLKSYSLEVVCLSDAPLTDYGSLIFVRTARSTQ